MATDTADRRDKTGRYTLVLVLTLICLLPFCLVAVKMHNLGKQRQAVKAIRDASGEVTYDYEMNHTEPRGPAQLRKRFGEDIFADVVAVTVTDDAVLEHLKVLTELRFLDLGAPRSLTLGYSTSRD